MPKRKCEVRSVATFDIEVEGDGVVDAYRNASRLAHDIRFLKQQDFSMEEISVKPDSSQPNKI